MYEQEQENKRKKMDNKILAEIVKKQISQDGRYKKNYELAEQIGISSPYLSQLLGWKKDFTLDILNNICQATWSQISTVFSEYEDVTMVTSDKERLELLEKKWKLEEELSKVNKKLGES